MASDTHADDAESAIEDTDRTDQDQPIKPPVFENDRATARRVLARLQALPS